MRLLRGKVPLVLDKYDYTFELGKAKLLEEGNEVLIISSGIMTMRALETAQKLREDNVSVAVLHVPTIKPLDEETLLAQAAKPGRLVITAENHTCVGGLSEAVAALLMRKGVRCDFDVVALPDEFLLAGALPTLHDRYGISTHAMVEKIKQRLK
jgi:transketolase